MGRVKYENEIKAKRNAWSKYAKTNTKAYTFRLMRNTDSELIDFIDSIENKTDTFRRLFTEEMKKGDRD